MKAVITIDMDSSAFGEGGEEEYNRIIELQNVMERIGNTIEEMGICRPGHHCIVRDSDNKIVGKLVIEGTDPYNPTPAPSTERVTR